MGMSHALTNIGITYFKQNDIQNALEISEKEFKYKGENWR